MNEDVLTVRQFAKIVGVSYQSVYKRINHKESTIQPYIVNRVNRQGITQTYLDKRILDDPKLNPERQVDSQPVNPATVNQSTVDSQPVNPVDQPLNNPEKATETAPGDDLTAHLQGEVKFLREQLERLTASLQFEQKKNAELSAQLHLLQSPQNQEKPPDAAHDGESLADQPQQKGFRAWWHELWNAKTPQK